MIADNSVIIRSKKRILDCFISDFKLEDFKRIQRTQNRSCKYSRFQLTLNQTKKFFGTPGILICT